MNVERRGTKLAIAQRLKLHEQLTAELIKDGWGASISASQVAYAYIIKQPNQPKREYEAAAAAHARITAP